MDNHIIQLEIKGTTYTVYSASSIEEHLVIDNLGRLRTKQRDKRGDFSFLIVSFPFLYSNISAAPSY